MNKKRVEKNFKVLDNNIYFSDENIKILNDRLGIRVLIDLKHLEDVELLKVNKIIEKINDKKHCNFNLYHKKIFLT